MKSKLSHLLLVIGATLATNAIAVPSWSGPSFAMMSSTALTQSFVFVNGPAAAQALSSASLAAGASSFASAVSAGNGSAISYSSSFVSSSFVSSPVDEPSGLVLGLAGLAAVAYIARRRLQKNSS